MPKVLFLVLLFCFCNLNARSPDSLKYTLEWGPDAEHTFYIQIDLKKSPGKTTEVRMPAWRPGRYMLQNYAAAVSHFEAKDFAGNTLKWAKTDKDTWSVQNPNKGHISISYRFYANTLDAGSSYAGRDLYYFNGINLFMYVPGKENTPCALFIPALQNPDLKIATAMPAHIADRRRRIASSYHHLVDCPVIISPNIHSLNFQIDGVQFYLHFQGNYRGNKDTDDWVMDAAKKLFSEQAAIFDGFPFQEYHCLYLLNNKRQRHAVEHATSSCYSLPEEVTSTRDAMKYGVIGITSHEFWHVWNVKKFRPLSMTPYQYDKEAYTAQHWFTEGVTSYMEELTLHRAGLRSETEFLQHLSNTFQSLDNSYATSLISPADASFDTWLSGNRLANPFHRTSFYPLGERCGFLLDMHIRIQTQNNKSIDDLFQYLHKHFSSQTKGIPEEGIQKACEKITEKKCDAFFNRFIYGTQPIPYNHFLSHIGMNLSTEIDHTESWPSIGIQTAKEASGTLYRIMVRPGSDAMLAGLGDDDIIGSVNGMPVMDIPDDFFSSLKPGDTIIIGRIQNLNIEPIPVTFSGNNRPVIYDIEPVSEPTLEQSKYRADWLQSRINKNGQIH